MSEYTNEGLPLNEQDAAPSTAEAADGPTRRINVASFAAAEPLLCSPPSSAVHEKAAPEVIDSPPALVAGPCTASLLEDDENIVHYFEAPVVSSLSEMPGQVTRRDADPSHRWDATEETIPTLPLFYPLERTSVSTTESVSSIILRVSAILEERSIVRTIRPAGCVDCSTRGVNFRIRLYKERDDSQKVIVEVQRREGFDLRYMCDVYAILDAAEGREVISFSEVDESQFRVPTYHVHTIGMTA